MTFFEVLTLANSLMLLAVLALLAESLVPHVKQGLVLLRDLVLWCALVVVVGFAGWIWWHRDETPRVEPAESVSAEAPSDWQV